MLADPVLADPITHLEAIAANAEAAAANAEAIAEVAEVAEPWMNVKACIQLLESAHEYTGLPWWACISLTTILVRSSVLPLVGASFRNNAGLLAAKPELERNANTYKERTQRGLDVDPQAHQARTMEIFKKHNCNPMKAFLVPAISMPMFVTFFFSLRALAESGHAGFQNGGALWFQDLSVMDPYYVLPLVSSATMLVAIELGGESGKVDMGKMKMAFRGLAVGILPFIYDFPAGVFLYWISSNSFSAFQAFLFKTPVAKKFFKIPDPPEEQPEANPYIENVKEAREEQTSSIRYFEEASEERLAKESEGGESKGGKRGRKKRSTRRR